MRPHVGINKKFVAICPVYDVDSINAISQDNVSSSEWSIKLIEELLEVASESYVYVVSPCLYKRPSKNNGLPVYIPSLYNFKTPKCRLLPVLGFENRYLKRCSNFFITLSFLVWQIISSPGYQIYVFTYNTYADTYLAASILRMFNLSFTLVPIILDLDDPRQDNWKKFVKSTRFATKIVFISEWAYNNYPGPKPKHLFAGALGQLS